MKEEKIIFEKINNDENTADEAVKYGEEILYINKDRYDYLLSISSDLSYEDINDKIMALFSVMKYQDAWYLMENNIDIIDYSKIKSCRYFMINPNASNFYDKIYERCIIDDREYAYYNILSGSLNQDFWDKYIKNNNCISFSDICTLVHNTYNGLSNNDIPLIKFGNYEKTLMDKYIKDNDKLDEFIYDKPAFLFPVYTIYNLMDNNHFNNINKILFVISQIIEDEEYDSAEWKLFWDHVVKYKDTIKKFDLIATDKMLFSLINLVKNNYEIPFDLLMKLLVNSKETPYYIHIVNDALISNDGINLLNDINISDFLDDSNMALSFLYKVCGMNISDYEFISVIQDPTYCIYNKKSNNILFGNNIYDGIEFASLNIWDNYMDDYSYEYHEVSDFEKSLLSKFDDDKITYENFMRGVCELVKKIRHYNTTKEERIW